MLQHTRGTSSWISSQRTGLAAAVELFLGTAKIGCSEPEYRYELCLSFVMQLFLLAATKQAGHAHTKQSMREYCSDSTPTGSSAAGGKVDDLCPHAVCHPSLLPSSRPSHRRLPCRSGSWLFNSQQICG